jgi:hypothetical protein
VLIGTAGSELQSLTYRVVSNQNAKESLTLLQDVTGYFKPRQMAALVMLHSASQNYLPMQQKASLGAAMP